MGKKVREYKSGDFIFAKVKGYPAWPARVQKMNGKKYFVYFYGTGETANLPPNMIFDYAENKDKFLTKTPKRRDFNEGVKQIEYDFANNVPLEQVIGVPMEVAPEANDSVNDSALGATFDGDTTANDTAATADETHTDAAMESDDTGNLVIDEGKAPVKGRKSKPDAKTPAKEVPKKDPKTPRGKTKREEKEEEEKEKKEEEIVSRSGRKIRPKRYIDEETDETPIAKKRRATSPVDKDKGKNDKGITQYNAVKQSELEGLTTPFKPVDEEKDNILIAYLSNGVYVGIKLFQNRPTTFKNDHSKLQWDKQAARNAITLKYQLERDQISSESVQGQLVMDLNLTDEEKAALDKERETEEKKARLQFLKTEMKLIDLDSKIKTCLCLEKADTEMCLTLLDELMGLFTALEVRPLMLLKHPTCLETVKRMRAYVGNTPSWDLSEKDALTFNKQAHRIRRKADALYHTMKDLFVTPDGLSFWEYFSERVVVFKKATANLSASELLEMVHEPLELSQPSCHTMVAAIEEANKMSQDEPPSKKNKPAPAKSKKPTTTTPAKGKRQSTRKQQENNDTVETQDSPDGDKEGAVPTDKEAGTTPDENDNGDERAADGDVEMPQVAPQNAEKAKEDQPEQEKSQDNGQKTPEKKKINNSSKENDKDNDNIEDEEENKKDDDEKSAKSDKSPAKGEKSPKSDKSPKKDKKQENSDSETSSEDKSKQSNAKNGKPKDAEKKDKKSSGSEKRSKDSEKGSKDNEKVSNDSEKSSKDGDKSSKDKEKSSKDGDKSLKDGEKSPKGGEKSLKDGEKSPKDDEKSLKDGEKSPKDDEKSLKDGDKSSKDAEKSSKDNEMKDDKEGSGETRAKRPRESKKTEPPPRSPAKRKAKN